MDLKGLGEKKQLDILFLPGYWKLHLWSLESNVPLLGRNELLSALWVKKTLCEVSSLILSHESLNCMEEAITFIFRNEELKITKVKKSIQSHKVIFQ